MADALVRFLAPPPPGVGPTPRPAEDQPRWARPLGFTIDLSPQLRDAWMGNGLPARRVSREEALRIPAVKRVRDLIAATIGRLAVREYDPGWHVIENELLAQPEADVPRSVTYAMTAEDLLFEAVAWWRIVEWTPEGWPRRVVRLEARSTTIRQTGKVYTNSINGQSQGMAWEWVPDHELIRFDSPCAALLTAGAQTIRDCMALARSAARNVDNPVPIAYVTPADGAEVEGSNTDVQKILDEFGDALDRSSFPYLNGSLKVVPLSWSPEQLQLGKARDDAILEVARMGGVDPEELGVSTTSRTYANAEQRRLDLLEFTVQPYVVAFYERLSMDDVTFPGNQVRFVTEGFLRADTAGRMDVYAKGRDLGLYPPERLSDIEEVPVEWIKRAQKTAAASTPLPGPRPPAAQEETVASTLHSVPAIGFTAPVIDEIRFGFDLPPAAVAFKADGAKRTVSGMVMPWNIRARSQGYTWEFAPNSLHWSTDSRVKLDKDHGYGTEFGRAIDGTLKMTPTGLAGSFLVGRSAAGDEALNLAADGVYDGFSAYVTFDGEGDGYEPHPDEPAVRRVYSATLRKVALTAMPAFDDARVDSVAATRNGVPTMTAPAPPAAPPAAPVPFDAAAFTASFTAGFTPALAAAVAEAFKPIIDAMPQPQAPERQHIPAGRRPLQVTEPMVYAMNGQGPSFVRDAWKARTEGDHEARERVLKFQRQTEDLVREAMSDPMFAISTGNAGALIPPGFRPEMYVTQLLRGRPLVGAVSRGTLTDASPFNIPSFVSATGATADHVEGVNPTEGSMSVNTVTVSPGATSGLYKITREMADSSNPAIDAIATQAMSESYSQQTEAKLYTELNGANGVGGVITSGFVPSGAQASAVTEDISDATNGKVFLAGIRTAMALYPFRRFAAPDFAFLSQEGTTTFATAVDTTGRPLLPWVGANNAVGTSNTMTQGYFVDGLTFQPAWSMTGNAAGDADAIMGNRNDVWFWESPTLMFRFEERSGPAFVELALFGYSATRVLRPIGLSAVRLTIQA